MIDLSLFQKVLNCDILLAFHPTLMSKHAKAVTRQRKKKNVMKNLMLGTDYFAKKVLAWQKQVVIDFEKEFGDEVSLWVAQGMYIKVGDKPGEGSISWFGTPWNTIEMIGHLIRQLAKDGVKNGGMTPEESGASLMHEILSIAALDQVESLVDNPKEVEEIAVPEPSPIITDPKQI